MKIAVCIKRVPDMDLRFAIGAGGKALDPPGSSTTSPTSTATPSRWGSSWSRSRDRARWS